MSIGSPLLPPRRALVDDVYDAVLTLLMDRAVQPGSRVSIEGVSRQLLVSPTPVREALARLESEGLITKEAGKGYRAAELLDAEGLRHLFDMRLLLEPVAARLAATATPAAGWGELDDLQGDLDGGVDSSLPDDERYEGYRAFAERDARFHHLIAARSGNELLSDAVVRLRSHMHLYRLYFHHGIAAETSDEHRAIADALRAGDPTAAEAAMRHHIEASYARMSSRDA
ncbi:GntR family transcriptional regulator [Subtercola sp. Z020]|uniref:GntR family transcriptional regulator n=1 Tax=Subtercola sp. Z020 TaxID=2080582 RepID=UPI000CE8DDF9|nr:GntR family transcriptional regulator [Subtercola sp. Z020]PPF77686.1 GntR family transcriptional regulator [Subtercola sp. Z020]